MKTALVTGGGSGMGATIVKDLLDEGLRVVSIGLEKPAMTHKNLVGLQGDLSSRDGIEQAAELTKGYEPTVFIHNAGAIRSAYLEEVSFEDLNVLVNLHLGASIFLAQACLPFMKRDGFGRIVLISSRAAVGLASRTVYTATKSAQIGMVRTWALELGPHGVTVNAIAPGPIATPMFRDVVQEGSEKEASLLQSLPMRRIGESGDISRAVRYFTDPENNFVTGQTLYVCGGASVGYLQI